MNFAGAIRGMRNPLNSWDKSDSIVCPPDPTGVDCDGRATIENPCPRQHFNHECFCFGKNDLDLARRLIKVGSDHRKFLRQIFVSVDITAPLYWWKEFDTYKVATVANSCSTMHKIHAKEIELSDFSFEDFSLEEVGCNVELSVGDLFINVVADCEYLRKKYLETKDRKYWRALIQLLPESYNQKRTVTLNYETLRNIYGSRKGHKLSEWSVGFMKWIESLPYSEELITS
jgi:hypothetical protein